MAVLFDKCKRCAGDISIVNSQRTTVKKYCSAECREAWWNESRYTGSTWGKMCDKRYGKIKALRLKKMDAVWLAGVVDGEGTIGIYKQKRPGNKLEVRYFANLEVVGTHRGFVEKVANMIQTPLCVKDQQRRNPHCKKAYGARIQRRLVPRVAETILPYLVIKKEQAELVLEFSHLMYQAPVHTASLFPKFEEMYQRMKVLNKRGT